MAQTLKDSQRELILDSARNELVEKGRSGVSMRNIADNANMTVGNLYRYYKNKEDLINAVLLPAMEYLDSFEKLSSIGYGESGNEILQLDEEQLNGLLDRWVEKMAQAQESFQKEMLIIVSDDEMNANYCERLVDLVNRVLYAAKGATSDYSNSELELASLMIAKSVFCGLREGVRIKCNNDIKKEAFISINKKYIKHSFELLKLL